MLLIASACSTPLVDEDHGFVPMETYVNEGMGISSVVPVGWRQADAGVFVRGGSLKVLGLTRCLPSRVGLRKR